MRETSRILPLENVSTNFATNQDIGRNRRQHQTIRMTGTARPYNDRGPHRVNYHTTAGTSSHIEADRALVPRALPSAVNRFGNLTNLHIKGRGVMHVVTHLARRDAHAIQVALRQLNISGHRFNELTSRRLHGLTRRALSSAGVM